MLLWRRKLGVGKNSAFYRCKTADDRASLVRREGLYAARVSEWKDHFP